MGQARTLTNQIGQGRDASSRKRGMVHVLHRKEEIQFTCKGPHVHGIPAIGPTQHESWLHPTKGWRWRRTG